LGAKRVNGQELGTAFGFALSLFQVGGGMLSRPEQNALLLGAAGARVDGRRVSGRSGHRFNPAPGPPTEQHVAPRVSACIIRSLQTDPVWQLVAYLGGVPGFNACRLACLRRCCSRWSHAG